MNIEDLKRKLEYINNYTKRINIMEVCGTHTMAIGKHGIRELLNENINLLSGPGCPVCVTPNCYIDYVYDLAVNKNCVIATYGDMIRVPGSRPHITLERAKALGAKVKMVYSSMDAVKYAQSNPEEKVIFLGIGFETTAPATAIAVQQASLMGLKNFYVLSMHKRIEPVMRALLEDKELKIDGFLCPGHVAVITGKKGFGFLTEYNCVSAIAGFEIEEVIWGIYSLVKDLMEGNSNVRNVYGSVVRDEGNITAQNIINEFFCYEDDYWRGLGLIPSSGLKLRENYDAYNIEKLFDVSIDKDEKDTNGCQCGEVLKGKIKPEVCKLFGKVCTPGSPIGPCMVSSEGSCAARYKYGIF